MTFLAFLVGFGYAIVLLVLAMEALTYKPALKQPIHIKNTPAGFSVIINFRDEQEFLPKLLSSIAGLSFSRERVQFIFINDASSDDSVSIIKIFAQYHPQINMALYDRVVQSPSAKKDGITQALTHALFNHIVTTDADCLLPPKWLTAFEEHYTRFPDSIFVAAPVQMVTNNTLLSQLQASEMTALQVITMGGFGIRQPFLCNGANMSFTKSIFYELHGYEGNDDIASGDDIFLLEKSAALDASACYYLKDQKAIVNTTAKASWRNMIVQRARWAQKGTKTKSMLNKLVSAQVFISSVFFIVSPILLLTQIVSAKAVATAITLKIFTDVVVLVIGNAFFENKKWKRYVVTQLCIYPVVVVAVAAVSFTRVRWKGRLAPH